MNFWRHTWNIDDWFEYPYIASNFKNFGFVDAETGEEIDDSQIPDRGEGAVIISTYTNSFITKWKYDNYAFFKPQTSGSPKDGQNVISIVFRNNDIQSSRKTYWGYNWGYNGLIFHTNTSNLASVNSTGYPLGPFGDQNSPYAETSIYTSQSDYHTFFIPLKNNGFFLNTRSYGDAYNDNPWDIEKNISNPTLWTMGTEYDKMLLAKGHTSEGLPPGSQCTNLMAIPVSNNLIGTDFLYILFDKYYVYPNKSRNFVLDKKTIRQNLQYHETIPDFSQQTDSSSGSSQDPFINTHINFNRNTCTLIKYPYEATFLDNLFIMTTTPTTFTDDVGFFTINNRNFMKVFENIVVELPVN